VCGSSWTNTTEPHASAIPVEEFKKQVEENHKIAEQLKMMSETLTPEQYQELFAKAKEEAEKERVSREKDEAKEETAKAKSEVEETLKEEDIEKW
jgi:hypothetical protein